MNADLAHELLNELGSSIEHLETKYAALLQFLKDGGIVTDDKLAPYLTQAGNASDVRWRAARVRLERLISAQKEKEEKLAENEQHRNGAGQAPVQNEGKETSGKKNEGGGDAAPKSEAAVAATESAGGQSNSKKDSGNDERASGDDKKADPKEGTKGG